ncbi:RagB/SusD family nutrient uptake outer membrane protein [Hymenobacter sp. BT664]|uniref:RagB/SusD family nutrient uptake outer membrane protein n=1 Tax=Hymenobacter montanus TaxID=2771359 RepID=A0A927BAS4_9BACT|nr:RagB/SusD family nutrient uptake outer membrane protein [Hymenobacter montanus]MBD2766698.1 RagB/SusD family nutrient uptake outer membrane protein [Hymenobacter montanus]
MKKIFLLALGLSTGLLTGCKDFLDLKSTNSQPDIEFLKSASNVESVLVGAYAQLCDTKFLGGEVIRTSEEYGDNIDLSRVTAGGGAGAQFTTRGFSLFNSQGRDLWNKGYTAIARANTVIAAIDQNTFAADQNVKTRLKAEALFVRAVAHFELVRLFAKPYTSNAGTEPGIPLRITSVTTEQAADRTPRSPVGVIYNQVIDDLKAAEAALPSNNGNRATKWAAKAYLARVYFNKEDYTNAFTYSDDVIRNGGFNLGSSSNPTAVTIPFRQAGDTSPNGTPVIFQAVGTPTNDVSDIARNNFFNTNSESVTLPLSASLSDLLRNQGGRRDLLLVSRPASTLPFSLKYQGGNPINIPVIRLAEMHLTRAESAVRKGAFVPAEVRADYNILRTLADVPVDAITTSQAALLTAIQDERRIELFTENDRFHELRRLKQNIRGLPYNDSRMLLKIPDIEVQANPDIVQN